MRIHHAALAAAIALAGAVPGWAQSHFQGAGERSEMDCEGSSAKIEGAGNVFHVTGGCTLLTIEGASNRVHVDMAKGGTIRIVGADNEVHWTTPDGSRPKQIVTGAGNRLTGAGTKAR